MGAQQTIADTEIKLGKALQTAKLLEERLRHRRRLVNLSKIRQRQADLAIDLLDLTRQVGVHGDRTRACRHYLQLLATVDQIKLDKNIEDFIRRQLAYHLPRIRRRRRKSLLPTTPNYLLCEADGTMLVADGQNLSYGKVGGNFKTSPLQIDIAKVTAMAFAAEALKLFWAQEGGYLQGWNLTTQKLRKVCQNIGQINCLAVQNGRGVLAGAGRSGSIELRDMDLRCQAVFKGHPSGIARLVFSPDGNILTSGALDGTLELWDLRSKCRRQVLTGHNGQIVALHFTSADARLSWLVSAGADNVIRVWTIETGKTEAEAKPYRTFHAESVYRLLVPTGSSTPNRRRKKSYPILGYDRRANFNILQSRTVVICRG